MIDTANNIMGGNLSALANGYNASGRTTAQDGFTFSIISGTTNGTTAVTDYSTLPEGIWSGDVSVQFDATDQLILLMHQQGISPAFHGRNCYEKAPSGPRAAACRGVAGAGAGCRRYFILYEQRQQHAEQNDQEQHRQRSTDQYPSRTALFPLDGGQVIPMDKPDEVLLTPASLLLPARASDVIRFFYKGPADDKERYYRIVWFDQALSDAQRDNANRSAVATASARIGTITVVAPRQVNYRFQYANGSLTNTGNATLRILAYGPCLKAADGKECKENYYLMPGKSRRFTRVDTADKGRVALWQGEQFVPVK